MQLAAGSQARSLGAQQQCASIQKMRVSLLPLSRPLQPVRLSRAAVMVRAEAGGGLGGFFGKKSEKEVRKERGEACMQWARLLMPCILPRLGGPVPNLFYRLIG